MGMIKSALLIAFIIACLMAAFFVASLLVLTTAADYLDHYDI